MQYYGSKLSENIRTREPEGYLYCLNVPIARTGEQTYLRKEVGLDGEGTVQVVRTPEEVFNPAAMASFEGMPVCNDHPFDDVTANNVSAYEKGHVQNVRRGSPPEDDLLLADIVIKHKDLIDDVMSGKREISCGYNCNYDLRDDGKIYQSAIRGNHVAVVENGRAGTRVAIRDSYLGNTQQNERSTNHMEKKTERKPSFIARAVAKLVRDSEPDEAEKTIDELLGEQPAAVPATTTPPDEKQEDENPVPTAPAPAAQKPAPAPATDEEATVGKNEIATLLKQLVIEMQGLKTALVKPEAEPMDALEKELECNRTPGNDEAEVEVPPETIQDEEEPDTESDEDEPLTEGETQSPAKTSDAVNRALLSVLKDMRAQVATLPKEQRLKMSDSMTAALRKASGLTEKANGEAAAKLAKLKNGARSTKDSSIQTDETYGRNMMEKYNPHYKKN